MIKKYTLEPFLGRIAQSQYYVAEAYCYRRSSVVCPSVCHEREPCKNG